MAIGVQKFKQLQQQRSEAHETVVEVEQERVVTPLDLEKVGYEFNEFFSLIH